MATQAARSNIEDHIRSNHQRGQSHYRPLHWRRSSHVRDWCSCETTVCTVVAHHTFRARSFGIARRRREATRSPSNTSATLQVLVYDGQDLVDYGTDVTLKRCGDIGDLRR